MDYPGITTYEPTLLGLLILLAIATVLTYPCSLMLILLDIVKPAKNLVVWGDGLPVEIRDSDQVGKDSDFPRKFENSTFALAFASCPV